MASRKNLAWLLAFFFFLFSFSSVLAQTELTVSIGVGDTILTMEGFTSPNSQVTIKEGGAVVGTTMAGSSGSFSKSLLSQTPGMHTVSIYSTDENGLATATVTYSVSLTAFVETTLSNIILPSTVSVSQTKIRQGSVLGVTGQTVPFATVNVFVLGTDLTANTTAGADGIWSCSLNTVSLSVGNHSLYVIVTTEAGYQSESSETAAFEIELVPTATPTSTPTPAATSAQSAAAATATPLPVASLTPTSTPTPTSAPTPTSILPSLVSFFDINQSGRIELAEVFDAVKIWVTIWRKKSPEEMNCDLNGDAKCNLVDLSVLLYYVQR